MHNLWKSEDDTARSLIAEPDGNFIGINFDIEESEERNLSINYGS